MKRMPQQQQQQQLAVQGAEEETLLTGCASFIIHRHRQQVYEPWRGGGDVWVLVYNEGEEEAWAPRNFQPCADRERERERGDLAAAGCHTRWMLQSCLVPIWDETDSLLFINVLPSPEFFLFERETYREGGLDDGSDRLRPPSRISPVAMEACIPPPRRHPIPCNLNPSSHTDLVVMTGALSHSVWQWGAVDVLFVSSLWSIVQLYESKCLKPNRRYL
ncbi:hypothetical protein INR49_021559 [Caranx melampygus]|nr:hypothetical protein INR49_021559 [Caranx melampygus]